MYEGRWRDLQSFPKISHSLGDHKAKYFMIKKFMTPPINLSFLLKKLAVVFHGRTHSSIQRTEGVDIHNKIQTVVFTAVIHEILNSIFKLTPSGNV